MNVLLAFAIAAALIAGFGPLYGLLACIGLKLLLIAAHQPETHA